MKVLLINKKQELFSSIPKKPSTVWQDALMHKIISLNTPTYLTKIDSYLKNRNFRVKVNNELSDIKNIAAGVAQGSKLGPILFSCYINDIPKHFNTLLCMYADDTAILARNKNPNFIKLALNRHIHALEVWFTKWKIAINASKTEAIRFQKGFADDDGIITETHISHNGTEHHQQDTYSDMFDFSEVLKFQFTVDQLFFTTQEKCILEDFGLHVLKVNERGKRNISNRTIFFMPHCHSSLYNNLLSANWNKECLSKLMIIGNGMKKRYLEKRRYIASASKFDTEIKIRTDFESVQVIHSLSLVSFHIDALGAVPLQVWNDTAEPIRCYYKKRKTVNLGNLCEIFRDE
ncbi:RNA-directed DNA polymerase from mobile element jockey [Araneus ventricosus]|uniref:RNA-directed DNA polymerase from mobile element jockey n=1 Tax=Araneus ventricosus TaxID=182803 RepID=A0A4Y2MHT7_ARAVE|nr:RNA-directed DNA polymerase from mobile element jockey [Araneus ventricosus]